MGACMLQVKNRTDGARLACPISCISNQNANRSPNRNWRSSFLAASDRQEITTGDVTTGIEKVWCVEEVGGVGPKLKFHPLGDLKRAEQAEVEIHRARSSQAIAANVTVPHVRHGHKRHLGRRRDFQTQLRQSCA